MGIIERIGKEIHDYEKTKMVSAEAGELARDFAHDVAAVSGADQAAEGKCGGGAGLFGAAFAAAALRLVQHWRELVAV